VYDATGVTKIVATKANGVREVIRLHTDAGYTLDVTPDHLVYERSRGFVEAGTLRPGDQLEWHRRDAYGEREFDLREVAEAALAGWFQSDGRAGRHQGQVTDEAMTVTDEEYRWLATAIERALPDVDRREEPVGERGSSRHLRLSGGSLPAFAEKWGLLARRDQAAVPASLFTAP